MRRIMLVEEGAGVYLLGANVRECLADFETGTREGPNLV